MGGDTALFLADAVMLFFTNQTMAVSLVDCPENGGSADGLLHGAEVDIE